MQVLPTAPSPTVTHFMNLEALIFLFFLSFFLSFFWSCSVFFSSLTIRTKPFFRLTFCCLQTQAFGEREKARVRKLENGKLGPKDTALAS